MRLLNRLLALLLRSPLHRLASRSLALLTVTGRTSGRAYTFPVQYVGVQDRVTVVAGRASGKTWWRNLSVDPTEPSEVTIRLRGRDHTAAAWLAQGEELDAAMLPYLQRFPQTWKALGVEPDVTGEELGDAARAATVIVIDLSAEAAS